MTNKILPILTIFLFITTIGLFAQSPAVVVEYYENNSGEMYARTPDGMEYNVDEFGFGEELPVGTTLFTLDGDYAELRMDPAGTIIRVSENTNFKIEGLQGRGGSDRNTFHVAVGKFKAVVAKQDGALYSFMGSTAVCGVRGTQFIYSAIPGIEEIAYVLDGVVDYTNAAGQTVALGAGQAANAMAAQFASFQPPSDLIGDLERGMDFVKLRIEEVPGYVEELLEEAAEEEPAEGEKVAELLEEKEKKEPEAKAKTPKWLETLMKFLGMELGTTTIYDDEEGKQVTWAKAIIQPKFAFGKLKVALYLPIIYKEDMFSVSDWYRPEDNNEWSFGRDQGEWDEIALDALNDLILKIRYVQWADNRAPFFFKVGNLDNFTVGHGSIMRNYANDLNFPAERKVGLNLGVNREKGGVELMVNDAAAPEIFGGRVHFRPFAPNFKLGFGLSALADINPERVEFGSGADWGRPMFFNVGLDVDQPIIEKDMLKMILFADTALMIPYFLYPVDTTVDTIEYTVPAGLATEAIWYENTPRNWGVDAGIFGNLFVVDYRLEFLYSLGTFRPFFYGPMYDLESLDNVKDVVAYLDDPSLAKWDTQTMGIYGELGYTMEKVFYISGGYEWNWPINLASGEPWPDDWFWIELGIFEDLLPVYGSIGFARKGLAAPLIDGESFNLDTFFDKNLTLAGELVYSISPIMEIALVVTSTVFDDSWYPSVSILTRLND